jgi:hypothetical protein
MRDVAGRLAAAVLAALAALGVSAAALAQAQADRVGFVDGRLALRPSGEQRWLPARADETVANGQSLRTDARSKAALLLPAGTLDLAPGTRLDIIAANGPVVEFGLPQGRIRLKLSHIAPATTFAIDLPQGGVWIRRPGEYDIDAGTVPQPGRIAVLAGVARFTGHDADTEIKTDEAVVLTGINPVVLRFARAAPDEFVAWARARDGNPALPAAPLAGTGEPPATPRPSIARAATAPSAHVEPPPRETEERQRHIIVEERPRPHRRHERRFARVRHLHHAYAAYRPFNPLQPLFSLFGW